MQKIFQLGIEFPKQAATDFTALLLVKTTTAVVANMSFTCFSVASGSAVLILVKGMISISASFNSGMLNAVSSTGPVHSIVGLTDNMTNFLRNCFSPVS